MKRYISIICVGLLSTINMFAQDVTTESFIKLNADTKAAATTVTFKGTMNCSPNGDWRQLRDLAWQLHTLNLSEASCPAIPRNAFHSRHNLKHLTLPSNVATIGRQAFFACDNIEGTLTFPATTQSIGEMAFQRCSSLRGIVFSGQELRTIGNYAFAHCQQLKGTITLPEGLESIGDGAFFNCTSIEKVVIPSSVKYIGAAAFAGCSKLKQVVTKDNKQRVIGTDAFTGTKCRIATNQEMSENTTLGLIPAPNDLKIGKGRLTLGNKVAIEAPAELSNERARLQEVLSERTACTIDKSGKTTIHLTLTSGMGDEAYRLTINKDGITIAGSKPAGVFYGIMTLNQIMMGQALTCSTLPCLTINDEPRTRVRELMIDPSRHFIPFEDIKAFVPEMARYKLNSLHLHLGDDQAWRMEIKAYPLLTSPLGSSRIGMDDMLKPIEGFYTQDQMRELVKYAEQYHVIIVPEVEMPGHSVAAIVCYPWLTCGSKTLPIRTTCGVSNELLCASNERVYEFYGKVFAEMCDVFPAPYFHIGGDEAGQPALGCWSHCPDCTAFKKEHGFTENWQLQEYMFNRMIDTLQAHGKTPMFWYETDFVRIHPGCVTFAWRNGLTQRAIDAARANNAYIMLCPGEHCYFDYPDGQGNMPEKNWGMPRTTLEQTYKLDPAWGNDMDFERNNLFGVAGTLWSECINSTERIYYQAYPRALALAEAGWSRMNVRSWDGFQQRLAPVMVDMQRRGVPYSLTK